MVGDVLPSEILELVEFPPYSIIQCLRILRVLAEVLENIRPFQSPAEGEAELEVNTIGLSNVPSAIRAASGQPPTPISRRVPGSNLTTTPGSILNVTDLT